MDLPAPVQRAVAGILISAHPATFAALRLVSRAWQDAADQATQLLTVRVAAAPLAAELAAVVKTLRAYESRFSNVQAMFVYRWGGGNMRPSATHELASGRTRTAHGRQRDVPGMVWSDMLEITMRMVSRQNRVRRPGCAVNPNFRCNHEHVLTLNPPVPQLGIPGLRVLAWASYHKASHRPCYP